MSQLDKLNSAIRTEKDLKVRTRLIAVHAVIELAYSADNMAEIFDVTASAFGSGRNSSTGTDLRDYGTNQNLADPNRSGRRYVAGGCRPAPENHLDSQKTTGKDHTSDGCWVRRLVR